MAIGSLREVQCAPRDDERGGVMGAEAVALGEFFLTNDRGVGRVAAEDFQTGVMGACFERGDHPIMGQGREHSGIAPTLGFQRRFLGRKIQFLDCQRLAPVMGEVHQGLDRLADARLGLVTVEAVGDERDGEGGDGVAAAVGFADGQMIGVEVDPNGPEAAVAAALEGRRLGGDEDPPALGIALKAVADGLLQGERRDQGIGAVREPDVKAHIFRAVLTQGIGKPQSQRKTRCAKIFRHAALTTAGLALGTQYHELTRAGAAPLCAPFIKRRMTIGCQIELRTKQLAAAETDSHPIRFTTRLQARETITQARKPTLLVVALGEQALANFRMLGAGDEVVESLDDLSGLFDARLTLADQPAAALLDRGDLALEVDGDGIELPRRESEAYQVLRFQCRRIAAASNVGKERALGLAIEIGIGAKCRIQPPIRIGNARLVGALEFDQALAHASGPGGSGIARPAPSAPHRPRRPGWCLWAFDGHAPATARTCTRSRPCGTQSPAVSPIRLT